MKVRVLNCATIRPYFPPVGVATCCLLVESESGLVLIDAGLGTKDHLEPAGPVRLFKRLTRTFGSLEQTATSQLAGLGYSAAEVRHIVLTHLHVDHAGGLPDFPDAQVHVSATELDTARSAAGLQRMFYVSDHWAHGPRWSPHGAESTVDWFGFEAFPVLNEPGVRVLLVPLPGHTRGHCGVAVGDGERWILHCGDAVALRTKPGTFSARLLGRKHARLYAIGETGEPSAVDAGTCPSRQASGGRDARRIAWSRSGWSFRLRGDETLGGNDGPGDGSCRR